MSRHKKMSLQRKARRRDVKVSRQQHDAELAKLRMDRDQAYRDANTTFNTSVEKLEQQRRDQRKEANEKYERAYAKLLQRTADLEAQEEKATSL